MSSELKDLNPTDVRWDVIKRVYDNDISKEQKKLLIGKPTSVIMILILSQIPALRIENDDELLELQSRLEKHHKKQMEETLLFTK